MSGALCLSQAWPGMARTIYGDHQRFIDAYFKAFPGEPFLPLLDTVSGSQDQVPGPHRAASEPPPSLPGEPGVGPARRPPWWSWICRGLRSSPGLPFGAFLACVMSSGGNSCTHLLWEPTLFGCKHVSAAGFWGGSSFQDLWAPLPLPSGSPSAHSSHAVPWRCLPGWGRFPL